MGSLLVTLLFVLNSESNAASSGAHNREHFLETCINAYKTIAITNVKMTANSSAVMAKQRCELAAKPTDNFNEWESMTDEGFGCEIGVRAVLSDHPEIGNAHNLRDWKIFYGSTCEM